MALKTGARVTAVLLLGLSGRSMPRPDGGVADAWQTGAVIKVKQNDQYGAYLTDGKGVALYAFSGDEHGESACYSDCARIWPPFVSAAAPTLSDPSLDGRLLGAIIRSDGTRQVTYGGRPLYRYLDDGSGSPHGQKVTQFGGEWRLVSPVGRPVGH